MFDPQSKWPWGNNNARIPALLIGILVIFALLAGIDAWVTLAVQQMADAVRAPFYIITRAGNSDWILIPTLTVAILGAIAAKFVGPRQFKTKSRGVATLCAFIFACVAGAGTVVAIIKRLVGRARPVNFDQFGPFHFEPLNMDWAFQSFPSGDTTTIFALAMAIALAFPHLRTWAILGAALVAISRVMVGMHFPSDVFGGILLGTLGAYCVRNYFAHKGWLFARTADGAYRLNPNWFSDPATNTDKTT